MKNPKTYPGTEVSKTILKNYLINRSFLHKKAKSMHEVFSLYKCLQVDPISVVAKTHEISLYNRVEGFKAQDLNKALYGENRFLFEYWLQLYSIIPVEFFPYVKLGNEILDSWRESYFNEHKDVIEAAYAHIEEFGPTSAKELIHLPQARRLHSWKGGESHTGVLNFLWDTGRILVHSRNGNRKYYDLTDRIIPVEIFTKEVSSPEATEFILEQLFDYYGVVRYANISIGRQGYLKKQNVKDLFYSWLDSGQIVKLKMEDITTPYFMLKKDFDLMPDIGRENKHKRLNIISPLDPLILDRKALSDIFDFAYTWEAYVPKEKRKFGYYGMPILYNGEFFGLIELKKTSTDTFGRLEKPSTKSVKKLETINLDVKKKSKEFTSALNDEIKKMEFALLGDIKTEPI